MPNHALVVDFRLGFSLGLGRARRSGREAESRAVAPRRMNHSDSELGSRVLVWVSFF